LNIQNKPKENIMEATHNNNTKDCELSIPGEFEKKNQR
jgi:hypothetical protein